MAAEEEGPSKCPKCKSKMNKAFHTISGNAKYYTCECSSCGYRETKCSGILK